MTDDPNQYKIGDGVHAWNDLPLRGFDGTLVHELGDSQTAAMSQQGVTTKFNISRGQRLVIQPGGYIKKTGTFLKWKRIAFFRQVYSAHYIYLVDGTEAYDANKEYSLELPASQLLCIDGNDPILSGKMPEVGFYTKLFCCSREDLMQHNENEVVGFTSVTSFIPSGIIGEGLMETRMSQEEKHNFLYVTVTQEPFFTENSITFRGMVYYKNRYNEPIPINVNNQTFEFTFSDVEYLVIDRDDNELYLKQRGATLKPTDIVLLIAKNKKIIDGYLFHEFQNAGNYPKTISLLGKGSMFDDNSLNYNSNSLGEWVTRYPQDTIVKGDDGYLITLNESGYNSGIWILNKDLSKIKGKAAIIKITYKASTNFNFIVGSTTSTLQMPVSTEWKTVNGEVTIDNGYGDYRIFIFHLGTLESTATLQIKDIKIYSKDYNNVNSKKYGNLFGKTLSILGDSISTFGTPDQSNNLGVWTYPNNRYRYPQSNLFTEVGYTYWKMLLDEYGMKLGINESWAGSRVSNSQVSDSGDLGPNRCMSSVTRISHLGENGTPDIILVYGGTNDAGAKVTIGEFNTENPKNYSKEEIDGLSVETFADAYRAMLIRLMYYYPTSRIIVVLPNFTTSYYTIDNLDLYVELIKEACDFFGIDYIDIRRAGITIYNIDNYLPDGIHPNYNGMKIIYNAINKKFSDLDNE